MVEISFQLQNKPFSPLKPYRFLEGSVDEVSFLGPELGALRGLLVGPEQGRWFCDEIDVYSSRTGHTDRSGGCGGLGLRVRGLEGAEEGAVGSVMSTPCAPATLTGQAGRGLRWACLDGCMLGV